MRRALDIALVTMFALALLSPLATADWSGASTTIGIWEKRRAPPFPSLPMTFADAALYPGRFAAIFGDRFGFRHAMVDLYGRIEILLFHRSSSDEVMVGDNGFLFYTGWKSMPDWQHEIVLPRSTIDAWDRALRHRADWLAARGIRYLFVVAPDKQTIYPEFVPSSFVRRPGYTRLQQIERDSGPRRYFLDLTAPLVAAKQSGLMYFKLDSHWTPAGALIGYNEIMRRLGIAPHIWSGGGEIVGAPYIPDLALMSGVGLTEPLRSSPHMQCAKILHDLIGAGTPSLNKRPIPPLGCAGAPERLLVFHDSFVGALAPLLSETFGRVTYVDSMPSFSDVVTAVDRERPTIVIEERVERQLDLPPEE